MIAALLALVMATSAIPYKEHILNLYKGKTECGLEIRIGYNEPQFSVASDGWSAWPIVKGGSYQANYLYDFSDEPFCCRPCSKIYKGAAK